MNNIIGKYNKLTNNIVLFTISSFGTKIISFLLIPLYTNFLSTGDYGTVDMLNTIVQLLVPITNLSINEAILRFAVDDSNDSHQVLFIGFKYTCISLTVLGISDLVIWVIFPQYLVFSIYVTIYTVLSQMYAMLTSFLRGVDKVSPVVVGGMVLSFLVGICNIIFLVCLKLGVLGYLSATILGVFITSIYLLFYIFIIGKYKPRKCKSNLQKAMLRYSLPTIVNGLSWWINNSIDRLFVINMLGVDANGIYAVAYKIPSILSIFQTIFNQAWSFSAFKEYKADDKPHFYSNVYNVFSCGMLLASCGIVLLNIPLAKALYAKAFFKAWKYTSTLVAASFFSSLGIIISPILSAENDTKSLASTTAIGAVVNVVLNYFLIRNMGIIGAAIATLISNISIWLLRMVYIKKYIRLELHVLRDIISYILLILQVVFAYNIHIIPECCVIFVIILLYKKEITQIIEYFHYRIKIRVKDPDQ